MRLRPEDDPRNAGDAAPVDWEDNVLSNFLAWGSYRLTPAWCQAESHWTTRSANYLFTSCPCCMLLRGVVVGLVLSVLLWGLSLGIMLLVF